MYINTGMLIDAERNLFNDPSDEKEYLNAITLYTGAKLRTDGLLGVGIIERLYDRLKEYKGDTDLFHHIDVLPDNVKNIIATITESQLTYADCQRYVERFEQTGFTCDYDLSGELYNLRLL